MGLKTVQAEDDGVDFEFELEMRQRARKIIKDVFAVDNATPRTIEKLTQEIIVTNEDGFDEDAIAEEMERLRFAREWSLRAYDSVQIESVMLAYDVLFGATDSERWYDTSERLDEISEKLSKRR